MTGHAESCVPGSTRHKGFSSKSCKADPTRAAHSRSARLTSITFSHMQGETEAETSVVDAP